MTASGDPPPDPAHDDLRDLGFGVIVARDSRMRLLNRDGTFNTGRRGVSWFRSVPFYEQMVAMGWTRFYLVTIAAYVAVNIAFAAAYVALGPQALDGLPVSGPARRFVEAVFFSVQTLTTVGYGGIAPATVAANIIVSLEALVGLGGFAVIAGLVFARLARPTADIRFSRSAVVAPYRGGTGFMFRIANASRGEVVDASVRVIFSWIDGEGALRRRRFEDLDLERTHLTFFPLTWTVVHPIASDSPLYGWDEARLVAARAEFLIQVAATAETYFEVVRARSSYVSEEVAWGVRFTSILEETDEGEPRIDLRRIDHIEPAPLPVIGPDGPPVPAGL